MQPYEFRYDFINTFSKKSQGTNQKKNKVMNKSSLWKQIFIARFILFYIRY